MHQEAQVGPPFDGGGLSVIRSSKKELKTHFNHHVDVLYDAGDLGIIDNLKEYHAIKHKVIQKDYVKDFSFT